MAAGNKTAGGCVCVFLPFRPCDADKKSQHGWALSRLAPFSFPRQGCSLDLQHARDLVLEPLSTEQQANVLFQELRLAAAVDLAYGIVLTVVV